MKKKLILSVASGGGHWVQMMRLTKAFEGADVVFVGVKEMYRTDVSPYKFYSINDVSRLHKRALLLSLSKLFYIFLKERPSVVVTTGSAPGMLALKLGKIFGAKTIWIDSIANVEEMSLSGKTASKYADLWLTQWPHLERPEGPRFLGSLL